MNDFKLVKMNPIVKLERLNSNEIVNNEEISDYAINHGNS